MNYKFILVLLFIICGCSKKTTPLEAYKELKEKRTLSTHIPTSPLSINENHKFELKISDSVMTFGEKEKIYTNYKGFNFNLESNKKYKLTVSSICDCFGFKKYIFIPLVSILDSSGTTIKMEELPDTFDYKNGPLSLNKTWIINNFTSGNYKLYLASNNMILNESLYKFLTSPIPMTINIKTSIGGKFNISIEEIKEDL
ncbi:hypothetical protein NYQ10_06905 [Flavobacterium johnsoniae]|uniref:hypothetical protein n=1 Tax=Flavobacterium johnsoniae TaxID=986 RepID=UPI0025B105CF|nr:hypothetical protein [Flavobacterium johnsoniae]WJS96180.1 hypothetical protein NYQ10_06905 [Flavobacterium johnsoniae]